MSDYKRIKSKTNKKNRKPRKENGGRRLRPIEIQSLRDYQTLKALIKSNKSLGFSFSALPRHQLITMSYHTIVSVTALTALTAGVYTFNMNDIYDPDYTGTGHQPYSRDQYAQFYNKYLVLSCQWEVHCPASNQVMFYCMLPANRYLPYTPTSITDYNTICETPPAIKHATSYQGGNPAKFTGILCLATVVGVSPAQYLSGEDYSAAIGASPNQKVSLNFCYYNANAAATPTFIAEITLTYKVYFYDPTLQSGS